MIHFRQLRDEASGAFSYLLGCGRSGHALLIDPVVTQTALYLGMLDELGLRLDWVLETHLHADRVTAADALRAWTGAGVAVGADSGIAAADRLLRDGDALGCGDLELAVLATSGHTPGCLSYLWGGRLFSGDCLLIGACGRLDEPGGDGPRLFDSVTRRLFVLPDETLVYPGRCRAGRRVSTIGEERETNPLFHGVSRDGFAARAGDAEASPILAEALEANRHCGRRRGPGLRQPPCAAGPGAAARH